MTTYFGNTLTDLQNAQSGTERVNAQRAIASEEAATRLAIQRIVSAIEQQKADQQGQYQQGQLGVANREVDAGVQEAALKALFNQQQNTSQINENALDRALREKQIQAQFGASPAIVEAQKLKDAQNEIDRGMEEDTYNKLAIGSAAEANVLFQTELGKRNTAWAEDRNKALPGKISQNVRSGLRDIFRNETGSRTSEVEMEFNAKRLAEAKAGYPDLVGQVVAALGQRKGFNPNEVMQFDTSRREFVPILKTTTEIGRKALGGPTASTGTNAALQQLFGTGTQTATQLAPMPQYFSTASPPARAAQPRLDPQVVLLEAKRAIAAGKDPEAVRRRVIEMGVTPDF